jgi:hypothetical protein
MNIQQDSVDEAQQLPGRARRRRLGRGGRSGLFRFLNSGSATEAQKQTIGSAHGWIKNMTCTCNELSFAKSSSFVMLPALSCNGVRQINATPRRWSANLLH